MLGKLSWNALISGSLTILIGVFAIREGMSVPLGTLNRMGPGYFPLLLGAFLAFLGVLLIFKPDGEPDSLVAEPSFRGIIGILGGMIAFAVLLRKAGLVPAIFALVLISAFAERPVRPLQSLVIAVVMSAVCVGVFVYALGVPLVPFIGWWR